MSASDNLVSEMSEKLRSHSEEVVRAYRTWFGGGPQRPQRRGFPVIEYLLPGAAAYYMADGQTIVQQLALTPEAARLRESIQEHLGAENWKAWETLVVEVNNHISAVAAMWKEIAARMESAARQAGLAPSSQPVEAPVDRCWVELFVGSIWREAEYYQARNSHSWADVKIVEETFSVPMRHTLDTVQTWVFEGSNMVRSQSKESLETIRRAWAEEAERSEASKSNLMADRARIEKSATEFMSMLRSLEAEYATVGRLKGQCSTCRPWVEELDRTTNVSHQ